MNIYILIQVLISGVISGLVIFQSAFVAPTVFSKIPEENRPLFLRNIFPKLFKSITVLGIAFSFVAYINPVNDLFIYLVGFITIFSGIICYAIIPATNKAKDAGENETFWILHQISVLVTLICLIVNLTWLFLLSFV